jgi:hypothetical protein
MPQVRKTTQQLEISGTMLAHPEVKRARAREAKADVPLGLPPKHLSADEKAMWHEILFNAARGTLLSSDRLTVEILAIIFAKFRRREKLLGSEWTRMGACLSLIGFTPADRSRVTAPDASPDNPFAEFAQ